MNRSLVFVFGLGCFLFGGRLALAQTECSGWGNLRGIRVDGELMAFTTGIRAVAPGAAASPVGDKLVGNSFSRDGNKQICTGGLPMGNRGGGGGGGFGPRAPSRLNCTIVYEDVGPGSVSVDVELKANADVALTGVDFFVHLPSADYSSGTAELSGAASTVSLAATRPYEPNHYLSGTATGFMCTSAHRHLEVSFESPRSISVQDDRRHPNADIDISFPLCAGNMKAGDAAHAHFTIKASGDVDRTPVNLVIDSSHPGSLFDGIGGNFRLQTPADPAVIQYNLDHLRVAWGRVAMPLNLWQPTETEDPIKAAGAGKLDDNVRQAMEMAGTLAKKNIPMIISVWTAPAWALSPRAGGFRRARKINPDKWDEVCKSIGSYLQYLKRNYGAEPRLFSFNESNIGIDVLQSPQDHADAIKRLGAYFEANGLSTKMLLGDTGDPIPTDFINTAMADPQAVKYIGAVSFHSWRGGTIEQFTKWGAAAKKLNVPLLVAEGGTDSNSFAYPKIFLEPWYGLEELSLYAEICRVSQPLSILQWQLTENYSLLSGGGKDHPLQPTERFWLLKQLDATPVGSAALAITSDKAAVLPIAYCDVDHGIYTVHLVNNGATRPATIGGLPGNIKELKVFVTDSARGMKEMPPVPVTGGTAQLMLDTQSFTTLMSNP